MASQQKSRSLASGLISLSLLAFLFLVAATDFKSDTASTQPTNPRFNAVQNLLDAGGTFYLYSNLKDLFKKDTDQQLQALMRNNSAITAQLTQYLPIANKIVDRLGVYGLQDLGVSSISDNGMRRMKMFIGSSDGREKGCLKLLGGNPHPLSILDRVPADTLLLVNMDWDPQATWQLLCDAAQDANAKPQLDMAIQTLKQNQELDIEGIVQGLGNEVTLIANLSAQELQTDHPMPQVALMVRVKNAEVYEKVCASLKKANQADAEKTEGKLRITPLKRDRGIPLDPVLATDGEFLYFSVDRNYVQQLAAGTQTPLRNTDAFKKLSANLPTEGNGCFYTSPDASEKVLSLLEKGMDKTQPDNPMSNLIKQFREKSPSGNLTIRVNRTDGVLYVGHGLLPIMGAFPTLGVGGLAAIALPNFAEAQIRSKVSRTQSDLRSMHVALEAFHMDNNKFPVSTTDPQQNLFKNAVTQAPVLSKQPTFQASFPTQPNGQIPAGMSLTTPICYISAHPADPFAPNNAQAPICYYNTQNQGWVLWSCGPDKTYDITLDDLGVLCAGSIFTPELAKKLTGGTNAAGRAFTYDPSNGSASPGDIWRIKQ
jgi:hypothetical protein